LSSSRSSCPVRGEQLILDLVANVVPAHDEGFDIIHEAGRLHEVLHEVRGAAPRAIAL